MAIVRGTGRRPRRPSAPGAYAARVDRRIERARELIAELAGDAAAGSELDPSVRLAELGFDSLAFAELALALERELGVDLGVAEIDGSSTVGRLLALVGEVGRQDAGPGVPPSVGRLQGLAEALGGWALRWWLDLRVEGAGRVPGRGPAILAMNHESALDIPVAVLACPRRITFMAKRELFTGPFVSWSLERLGGFRVARERYDAAAVRLALDVLARGEVLGMFPEGTRSPDALLPFLPGSAWLALRTGAPLVPVAIRGTERAREASRPRRVRVRVRFGEPIAVERVEDAGERRRRATALTEELRAAVERLLLA